MCMKFDILDLSQALLTAIRLHLILEPFDQLAKMQVVFDIDIPAELDQSLSRRQQKAV